MTASFVNNLFDENVRGFEAHTMAVFEYQYRHNKVYRSFCDALGWKLNEAIQPENLPFLPISFFKSHPVVCSGTEPALYFESSGTGNSIQSKHFVVEPKVYEQSFLQGFRLQYGPPSEWCFLGLLPSYLERTHSSLVYMVNHMMQQSNHPSNGFYLYNTDALYQHLLNLEASGQKTMLFGVTYALLDFAEKYRLQSKHTIVMETGGMKGRRKEMIREEVHEQLQNAFGAASIHSEYGMTELLSQAYSSGDGIFHCPPWMKVLVRDEDAPLSMKKSGRGAINIIDLANVYSCSFIATDDVGEVFEDGSFKVLGRLDNSDIRGCSLLAL